ncbi:MAG TPA: sulfurtransferase [Pilimelia sp.]|nr:sulfurtransferase [Pilimelia sp.]
MDSRSSIMIDVDELAALLRAGQPPALLDVRWRLGGPPGEKDYRVGHVPGAVFVDLDTAWCGPPGPAGRHPLPDPGALQAALREAGVRAGQPVVVYDGGDGLGAARAWWTLRWAGHEPVRVLAGGFAAWSAAGGTITDAVPVPPAGDLTVRPGHLPVLDAAAAAALAADPDGVLLDVRAPQRYRGEVEPVDTVAGHIRGAVNLPLVRTQAPGGGLADRSTLAAVFAEAGVRDGVPVGVYCGSGVTAAQAVLALHLSGRPDAALYVGSWSNWVADPARPVTTGAAP